MKARVDGIVWIAAGFLDIENLAQGGNFRVGAMLNNFPYGKGFNLITNPLQLFGLVGGYFVDQVSLARIANQVFTAAKPLKNFTRRYFADALALGYALFQQNFAGRHFSINNRIPQFFIDGIGQSGLHGSSSVHKLQQL